MGQQYKFPIMEWDSNTMILEGGTDDPIDTLVIYHFKMTGKDEFTTVEHNFILSVDICYFRCEDCYGDKMDECTVCKPPFALFNDFCRELVQIEATSLGRLLGGLATPHALCALDL